jgi:ABC-2 type transport system permease protein
VSTLVRAVRAWPTLFRVGFAEAVAYRAEFLVWMLSTTMPLINMSLMNAIAREQPLIRNGAHWGEKEFTSYYLATLLVRMLTGAWVVWEMTQEIRQGTMSMRLLRPIHPFVSYASDNLAALPLRGLIAIPIIGAMFVLGSGHIASDPRLLALAIAAIAGAWLLNFLVNCAIGCLAFHVDSATSVFEIWLALWMLFSGYLFPLDLFPPWLARANVWLPFRLTIDLPVRCLTGMISPYDASMGLLLQLAWIAGFLLLVNVAWKTGMRRFGAFGG